LVELAKENKNLKARIEKILKESDLDSYLISVPHQMVAIVYRAFEGAWETASHPGLLDRDPTEILREYFYGCKGEVLARSVRLMKSRKGPWKVLVDSWKREYLGEPGTAARSFRLLA
jgi:hypothetical protein